MGENPEARASGFELGPAEKEAAMAEGDRVGEVIHYYDHIQVAVLRLARGIRQGQLVHFHGAHTDFEQVLDSLQVEHKAVAQAAGGTEVAVKVAQKVRRGDEVLEAG
jgi:hypothetical protein